MSTRVLWAKRVVTWIYQLLEWGVPKSRSVGFISFPDASDNALSLFAHLLQSGGSPELTFWLARDVSATKARLNDLFGADMLARNRIVRKNSLLGLWCFLRARRIYFTHGHYWFVRGRKGGAKLVNLWHGMPLKAIGLLDGKRRDQVQATEVAIASSAFFRPIIAAAFGISEDRVLLTGLPRCDELAGTSFRSQRLRNFFAGRKVILWMPTYAISAVGELRSDTGLSLEEVISEFASKLRGMSRMATSHQLDVIVKLHPMDALDKVRFAPLENVTMVTAEPTLADAGTYELLAVADGLITDVSSVSFDFMCTGRPILITTDVLKSYARQLVFDVDELLNAVFHSESIEDAGEFFETVGASGSVPDANNRFCAYRDDRSSWRVLKELAELDRAPAEAE